MEEWRHRHHTPAGHSLGILHGVCWVGDCMNIVSGLNEMAKKIISVPAGDLPCSSTSNPISTELHVSICKKISFFWAISRIYVCILSMYVSITLSEEMKARELGTRAETATKGTLIVFWETGQNCDPATLFGITKEHKNLRRENAERWRWYRRRWRRHRRLDGSDKWPISLVLKSNWETASSLLGTALTSAHIIHCSKNNVTSELMQKINPSRKWTYTCIYQSGHILLYPKVGMYLYLPNTLFAIVHT
jgi:hypothetical protein